MEISEEVKNDASSAELSMAINNMADAIRLVSNSLHCIREEDAETWLANFSRLINAIEHINHAHREIGTVAEYLNERLEQHENCDKKGDE